MKKKSNLIGRHYYNLTPLIDNLGMAYFFGPPCIDGGSKNEPLPNDQKIALKPVSEMRFIHQRITL